MYGVVTVRAEEEVQLHCIRGLMLGSTFHTQAQLWDTHKHISIYNDLSPTEEGVSLYVCLPNVRGLFVFCSVYI